MIYIIDGD
jgi:hypothetical protein